MDVNKKGSTKSALPHSIFVNDFTFIAILCRIPRGPAEGKKVYLIGG
jgi:hypothetical protein